MKNSVLGVLAAGSAAALTLVIPSAAQAAPSTASVHTASDFTVCTGKIGLPKPGFENGPTQYKLSTKQVYIGDRDTRTYGSGGGTITIEKGESVETGGSLSATTTAEAGVVFAKASVSVGVTISKSWSTSLSKSYSWTVPSARTSGWIEMGSVGYKITYERGHYKSPCTWVSEKKDTITGVTKNLWFVNSDKWASTPKP